MAHFSVFDRHGFVATTAWADHPEAQTVLGKALEAAKIIAVVLGGRVVDEYGKEVFRCEDGRHGD